MSPRPFAFQDPAAEASQFLIRLGFAVLAIAIPCGALVSRRSIFILFPLGAGVILVGALLAPRRDIWRRAGAAGLSPTGYVFFFLLAWSALSLLWTAFPAEAMERLFKTAGTLLAAAAVAIALPDRTRIANLYLVPIGLAAATLGSLTILFLLWSGGVTPEPATTDPEGTTLDRAMPLIAMLAWPAMAALTARGRWSMAGALAIVVTTAAALASSPVVLLALAAGGLTFLAVSSEQKRAVRVLAIIAAVLILAAPLIPILARVAAGSKTANMQGFLAPMAAWFAIIKADGVRLFLGHGLDSALRGVAAGYLPVATPRSILFEIWYELGIVGALALAGLAARALQAAATMPKTLAPFLIACLVTGFIIACLGLNTAQIGWLTVLAVTAILFTGVIRGNYRTDRPRASRLSRFRRDDT